MAWNFTWSFHFISHLCLQFYTRQVWKQIFCLCFQLSGLFLDQASIISAESWLGAPCILQFISFKPVLIILHTWQVWKHRLFPVCCRSVQECVLPLRARVWGDRTERGTLCLCRGWLLPRTQEEGVRHWRVLVSYSDIDNFCRGFLMIYWQVRAQL